mgnify:CR=1 FL=1
MGRDLPKLGAEPEPIDGPSVHQQKIQIALSIYQSILAQAALRTARLHDTHRHIVTSKSHRPFPVDTLARASLAPLVTKCHHIMYQGEKEVKERLELEEKREKVIPPALRLVQQARLDSYSPCSTTPRGPHDTGPDHPEG